MASEAMLAPLSPIGKHSACRARAAKRIELASRVALVVLDDALHDRGGPHRFGEICRLVLTGAGANAAQVRGDVRREDPRRHKMAIGRQVRDRGGGHQRVEDPLVVPSPAPSSRIGVAVTPSSQASWRASRIARHCPATA